MAWIKKGEDRINLENVARYESHPSNDNDQKSLIWFYFNAKDSGTNNLAAKFWEFDTTKELEIALRKIDSMVEIRNLDPTGYEQRKEKDF